MSVAHMSVNLTSPTKEVLRFHTDKQAQRNRTDGRVGPSRIVFSDAFARRSKQNDYGTSKTSIHLVPNDVIKAAT